MNLNPRMIGLLRPKRLMRPIRIMTRPLRRLPILVHPRRHIMTHDVHLLPARRQLPRQPHRKMFGAAARRVKVLDDQGNLHSLNVPAPGPPRNARFQALDLCESVHELQLLIKSSADTTMSTLLLSRSGQTDCRMMPMRTQLAIAARRRASEPPSTCPRCIPNDNFGLTLLEILVVIVIVTILVGTLIPVVSHARSNARSASCINNLSAIGTALRMYELDSGAFPDPGTSGTRWEDLLAAYTTPNTYCCPSDPELFNALSSSYDWRDTGDPKTTLAGLANSATVRPDCVLAFDALPGWHAHGYMNAITVGGAAESMPQETCLGDLLKPITR